MAAATTVSGTIARTNGNGFQLREHAGKWFNLSNYATPTPTVPPVGTEVRLTLDGSGYVRTIEPVFGKAQNPAAYAPGCTERPEIARGAVMMRLAVLKAAAGLLAGRPDVKAGDVLALADQFERWATR